MRKDAEAQRRELVKAFEARRPGLLRDLRRDFGGVVQDLRLFGSVLDPERFRRGSDVDVAVIVIDTPDSPLLVKKLRDALFGGGYLLCVAHRGEPFALDPLTMLEGEWPAWYRGRTPPGAPSDATGAAPRARSRPLSVFQTEAPLAKGSRGMQIIGCGGAQ